MNKRALICATVFAVVFLLATIFTNTPVDDTTYYQLRQIDSIQQTGKTFAIDSATHEMSPVLGIPAYSYLLSGAHAISPAGGDVLTALLYGITLYLVYVLAFTFTKSYHASVLAVLATGLAPALLKFFLGTYNPVALALPLLLYMLMKFAELRKQPKAVPQFILSIIVLSFIHPLVLIGALVLVTYWILGILFKHKQNRREFEGLLFTICFVLWSQFLLYKKAILAHGPSVVWQNIPPLLVSDVFAQLTVGAVIFSLGPVVVLGALITLVESQWEKRDDIFRLLGAALLATIIVVAFRLLPWNLGMALAVLPLAVLFAKAVVLLEEYAKKMKVLSVVSIIPFVIALLIIVSLAGLGTPDTKEIDQTAIQVISDLDEALVFAHPLEGHEIVHRTEQRVVHTSYFLFDNDANKKYQEFRELTTTPSAIRALEILKDIPATHIVVSPRTMQDTGNELPPITENTCFPIISESETLVIAVECQLEES